MASLNKDNRVVFDNDLYEQTKARLRALAMESRKKSADAQKPSDVPPETPPPSMESHNSVPTTPGSRTKSRNSSRLSSHRPTSAQKPTHSPAPGFSGYSPHLHPLASPMSSFQANNPPYNLHKSETVSVVRKPSSSNVSHSTDGSAHSKGQNNPASGPKVGEHVGLARGGGSGTRLGGKPLNSNNPGNTDANAGITSSNSGNSSGGSGRRSDIGVDGASSGRVQASDGGDACVNNKEGGRGSGDGSGNNSNNGSGSGSGKRGMQGSSSLSALVPDISTGNFHQNVKIPDAPIPDTSISQFNSHDMSFQRIIDQYHSKLTTLLTEMDIYHSGISVVESGITEIETHYSAFRKKCYSKLKSQQEYSNMLYTYLVENNSLYKEDISRIKKECNEKIHLLRTYLQKQITKARVEAEKRCKSEFEAQLAQHTASMAALEEELNQKKLQHQHLELLLAKADAERALEKENRRVWEEEVNGKVSSLQGQAVQVTQRQVQELKRVQALLDTAETHNKQLQQQLDVMAREQQHREEGYKMQIDVKIREIQALQRQMEDVKKNQEWMLQGIIQEKEKEISRFREEVHSHQERERIYWREREEREKEIEKEKSQLESAHMLEVEALKKSQEEAMSHVEERVRKVLSGKDQQIGILRAKILEYERELHGITA